MKLLVINGPNLNLLGLREPDIYGRENYAALLELIENTCAQRGIEVECFQSNHEGAIVDKIQEAYGTPGRHRHQSSGLHPHQRGHPGTP